MKIYCYTIVQNIILRVPTSTNKIKHICSAKGKISLGMCGRYTFAELVSLLVAICVVCIWVLTGQSVNM